MNSLICQYCGETDPLSWTTEVRDRLIANQRCHTCDYWITLSDKDLRELADKYVVTPQWTHYVVEPDKGTGGFRGFGGAPFVINWFNEARDPTRTRNLWHQGEIPELHRHRFTRNAGVLPVKFRLDGNGDMQKERTK